MCVGRHKLRRARLLLLRWRWRGWGPWVLRPGRTCGSLLGRMRCVGRVGRLLLLWVRCSGPLLLLLSCSGLSRCGARPRSKGGGRLGEMHLWSCNIICACMLPGKYAPLCHGNTLSSLLQALLQTACRQ